MGVEVTVEQAIECDRDAVAGFAMDPANDARWIKAPRRLAMKSVKAPFPMTVDYQFDEAAGGGATVARIHTTGDASGFYKLGGPLLSAAVRRGVARDLRELKRLLESPLS